MFYDFTKDNHPKGLFKSCIVPRPIAWISSISEGGVTNLAPFSYFQAICDAPPMIMFVASPKRNGEIKDTARNIEATKEFVINLVCENLKDEMSLSSNELEYGISEIEHYNIPTKKSNLVKPPSILSSPINLECIYEKTIPIEKNKMIIAKVIGISVDEELLTNNRISAEKLNLLARLGWNEYSVLNHIVKIDRIPDTEQKC